MRTLRGRLVLSAAAVVAAVVGLSTYLQSRIVGQAVEAESVDAAAAVALGLAADLGEHAAPPTADELVALLADYRKAVPAVQSFTIASGSAPATLVATTDVPPPPRALRLAELAMAQRGLVTRADDPLGLHLVAVSLERHKQPFGAVVVAVRMDALRRVRRQSREAGLVLASSAILLLVLALDAVARRLVHRPLRSVVDTMARASSGELAARAPVSRADEIGRVAEGLNAMLDRMERFNERLRAEVERATAEQRSANAALIDTAQRLFEARRELAKSQRLALAGEMAATVAHQIGTPLNVMSGYVQMLHGAVAKDSLAAQRLLTVQEQIARVTAIVQGLLDRTRRPALELAPAAPGELLEGLAELVRPTLAAAGIELALDVAPGLPRVAADRGQLEQALLNLVTNAIDAMPRGGRLTLRACCEDGAVALAVSDTGSGIAAEDLPRVFEPLFTTKPRGQGTGLGLPIVREVVAAHGGTVRLESRPESGTTAVVRLPAGAEE